MAGAAVAVYAHDRADRKPLRAYEERYGFAVRRPAWVETARLAPSADIGVDALASVTLGDALDPRGWGAFSLDERQAWLAYLAHQDEALADAQALLLASARTRPGWAYHRFLLGQLAYAAVRRSAEPAASPERWIVPLRRAEEAAPGETAIAPFLGGALLESWPNLTSPVREEAPAVLKRAFRDDTFVRRALPLATATLGEERAVALLPDEPDVLRTSRDALARAGSLETAARLDARWESAERRARARDLEQIRERAARRDPDALKAYCADFVRKHPPQALDGPLERRQLAEVLSLWPTEDAGKWRGDLRGDAVRFFLDGHLADVAPAVLAGTLAVLGEVPAPARALGLLLSRHEPDFQALLERSEAKGSLGFTPVFLEWARLEARAGRVEEARTALGFVAARATGECEALLARRDVARLTGDGEELRKVDSALLAAAPDEWSAGKGATALPLCIDPERRARSRITLTVRAPAPALLVWGFRNARRGIFLHPGGEASFDVPLAGEQGLVPLTIQSAAGAPVELARASIDARPAAQPAPTVAASVTATAGSERLKSTTP